MSKRIYKNFATSSYDEIWREIKNYPDYIVSNKGRVISYRQHPSNPQIIGSVAGKYKMVSLCNDKGSKMHSVHILVAETFIGPRPSKDHVCNHKDGIKLNNDDSNFEWITRREDALHAFKLGLRNNSNPQRKKSKDRDLWLMRKLLKYLHRNVDDSEKGRFVSS